MLPCGRTGRSSSSVKDTHSDWWEAMTFVRDVILAAGHSSSLRDHKEEEAEWERYGEGKQIEGNTSFTLSFQLL